MARATFVNLRATEKCGILIGQIQQCGQKYLWTSYFMSGRSSLNQEGFLKDDQIYFCKFLSYREVWYTNFNVHCKTNPMVLSKLLMEITLGIRKILIVFDLPHRIHSLTYWQRIKSNGVIKITYGHHPGKILLIPTFEKDLKIQTVFG